jgi:hypothetical protein
VPFFFSFLLFSFLFGINNMEDSKSDHYAPMSWKQCHKTRSILKGFLKGSTWKFTWNGLQISCIGIFSGHIGTTWFLGVGCTSRAHIQYKMRASKRLGATN